MRTQWLRGMVLAVSLALLLSGGVVLANGEISITTDPSDCWDCTSDANNANWLAIESSGWEDNETITMDWWVDGVPHTSCPSCFSAVNGEYNSAQWAFYACAGLGGGVVQELRYRFTGDTSGRWGEFTILATEDCAVTEFVPEPGSILLLGSGLVGLAGYATLRWRTRE